MCSGLSSGPTLVLKCTRRSSKSRLPNEARCPTHRRSTPRCNRARSAYMVSLTCQAVLTVLPTQSHVLCSSRSAWCILCMAVLHYRFCVRVRDATRRGVWIYLVFFLSVRSFLNHSALSLGTLQPKNDSHARAFPPTPTPMIALLPCASSDPAPGASPSAAQHYEAVSCVIIRLVIEVAFRSLSAPGVPVKTRVCYAPARR